VDTRAWQGEEVKMIQLMLEIVKNMKIMVALLLVLWFMCCACDEDVSF
jgi:hypothetical protein